VLPREILLARFKIKDGAKGKPWGFDERALLPILTGDIIPTERSGVALACAHTRGVELLHEFYTLSVITLT
jgi:hypothetical protein